MVLELGRPLVGSAAAALFTPTHVNSLILACQVVKRSGDCALDYRLTKIAPKIPAEVLY